ncbi:hypothetical protein QE152_g39654 [Popillia japonica]|uniref:Uncharacterized protein n=1 Tax=Popillia japonica TaxID=7064 RepID=A0AAW1HU44_POPJA
MCMMQAMQTTQKERDSVRNFSVMPDLTKTVGYFNGQHSESKQWLETIERSTPVSSKPYRVTNEERHKIGEIVREWKDAGLVTETSSPYASPVLLVKKKNGDARLVIDYRKLMPMLQIATSEDDDTRWDVHLKKIERDLNTSVNKSTGKSAFELLYGYIPRFKDGMFRSLTEDNETYRLPKCLQEEASQHMATKLNYFCNAVVGSI